MNNNLIKSAFQDDPEVLRALEAREQRILLKEVVRSRILEEGEKATEPQEKLTIVRFEKGEKGEKGERGEDGLDGMDGKDGKDADKKAIVSTLSKLIPTAKEVASLIPNPQDGKDGSPDTAKQIAKKINTLDGEIDFKVLKNPEKLVTKEQFDKSLNNVYTKGQIDMRWHGGGLSTVSHDTTLTGNGTPTSPLSVVSSGGGLVMETPTGTVDGSNNIFTVTHTPVFVIVDGLTRVLVNTITDINGNGFTYSAGTITVNSTVPPTSFIRSFYNA